MDILTFAIDYRVDSLSTSYQTEGVIPEIEIDMTILTYID